MSKLKWVFVFGVGYLAGSAAGRQRYEQIKAGAQKVTGNPRVQAAARNAQHTVQQTVAEKGPVVVDAIKDKVTSSGDGPAAHDPEAATGRPPLS